MPDISMKALIGIFLKGTGAKDAKKQVDAVGKSAKKTEKALKQSTKASNDFGKSLLGFVGLSAIKNFATQALESSADIERSFMAIRQQMAGLGLDAEAAIPGIRDNLEALRSSSGVLMGDLVPAYQAYLGILKDVDGAMFATKLTADLTNGALGDMSTNTSRLANLLQGEVQEAAKSLRLQLRDGNNTMKTQTELIEELITLYGGMSDSQDDLRAKLDEQVTTFEQLGQEIGETLGPAIGWVNTAIQAVINSVKTLGAFLGTLIADAIGGFTDLGILLGNIFDFDKFKTEGIKAYLDAIDDSVVQAAKHSKEVWAGLGDEIEAIWKDEEKAFEVKEGGKEALLKVALQKQLELAAKEATRRAIKTAEIEAQMQEAGTKARLDADLKALEVKRKAAIDAAIKSGASVAAINEEFDAARLLKETEFQRTKAELQRDAAMGVHAAELELLEEGSQERLDKELEILEIQKQRAVENAVKIGMEVADIERQFELAKAARQQAYDEEAAEITKQQILDGFQAELELQDAHHAAQLQGFKENEIAKFDVMVEQAEARRDLLIEELEAKREAELAEAEKTGGDLVKIRDKWAKKEETIEQNLSNAKTDIAEQEAAAKMEMQQAVVSQVFAGLRAVFGESKSVAIAEVLINTFMAASKTMATWGWPLGPIFAAIITAMGLAQANKIRTTEPAGGGRGFDDPAHDRLAFLGGRKWAEDVVAHLSGGFRSGLSDMLLAPEGAAAEGSSTTTTTTTIDESRTDNITFNGPVMGGRIGERRLARRISRARDQDQGRRL